MSIGQTSTSSPPRRKSGSLSRQANKPRSAQVRPAETLPKTPSGVRGLDEITGGGLPKGRPTLICGSAGCGKTLMAMEFIARGALEYGEPGVFMSFEEKTHELSQNVRSLGIDLDQLVRQKKLLMEHVHVDRSEIEETGEFDLEGLFIRLGHAIDTIKAKRVVLDTVETLFSGFSNAAILRSELRRLFHWLKDRGVTAVITGERGEGTLTRQGLEEYVSDCVILLDHRVNGQISTRRLRIVKYRGTMHGTNEYPFLISADGIVILPVTSLGLDHEISNERISTGIVELDDMLGGEGYYRGTTILISGSAGVGKTSLAAHLAQATAQRGERCLYFAFEESQAQLTRNMRSIGIDFVPHVKSGKIRFEMARPSLHGLETHLAVMHKSIEDFKPKVVVVDPVSNMVSAGTVEEAGSMLLRLLDFLKSKQITTLFTALTSGERILEGTNVGVSSLVDTWILLRDLEEAGERNRVLYVLKSRGMAHSNQLREFVLTAKGVRLIEPYLGPGGVMTGSARAAQEARDRTMDQGRSDELDQRKAEVDRKRRMLAARIAALQAEFDVEGDELNLIVTQGQARAKQAAADVVEMSSSRNSGMNTERGGRQKETKKEPEKE